MTILCVGRDSNILTSRASVLRTTGAKVIVASTDIAVAILGAVSVDLVVVCYSVSNESASSIYKAAKARTPNPMVLRLNSGSVLESSSNYEEHSDAVANTDPAALIRATVQLLGVSSG